MATTLRSLIALSFFIFIGFGLAAQVSLEPINYNTAYRPDTDPLLKNVTHPNCVNRPFLFIYVDDILRPECEMNNGSITLTVLTSEPNISLSLNGASPVSSSGDTYTFDNLDSGVYFIDADVEVEPDFVLTDDLRVLLNNAVVEEDVYAGIFEFDAAFCGLGEVRKADALTVGVIDPTWQIFNQGENLVGELDLFNTMLMLEAGEYWARLTGFDGCPILVDFVVPEVISFELTDDNFFFDDFSDSDIFPKNELWTDDQAFINDSYAYKPPTIGVATLDGLDENGQAYIPTAGLSIGTADRLTSVPFCMEGISESDNLYLSYFFQQQGLGDYPNSQDSLVLEFKDVRIDDNGNQHPGKWNIVRVDTGQNVSLPNGDFQFVVQGISDDCIQQPAIIDTVETANGPEYNTIGTATYFAPGFQFRFRNIATATGLNDHWHVDYVTLNKNGDGVVNSFLDVGHIGPAQGFLTNYTAMPWNQFVGYQDKEYNTTLSYPVSNNGELETQIENTFVKVTELCSETVIDDINAAIFIIDGAGPIGTMGSATAGSVCANTLSSITVLPSAVDTITNDSVGGDLLVRSEIPDVYDSENGIVIRTETVIDVSDDIVGSNDTLIHDQIFSNFYAYDDGSAEKVFKLGGIGSQFAMRFVLNEPDVVKGIGFAFNQISQNVDIGAGEMTLMVWQDITREFENEDGDLELVGTETLLTSIENPELVSFPFAGDQQNDYYHYYFNQEIAVTDTFYVGFELQFPNQITFGYDRNNFNIDKWFSKTGTFWESSVVTGTFVDGTPMVRAIMGNGLPIGIETTTLPTFDLFPNPVSEQLTVVLPEHNSSLSYRIFDASGKQLSQAALNTGKINVSGLSAGVYILELLEEGASVYKRQKFVKL